MLNLSSENSAKKRLANSKRGITILLQRLLKVTSCYIDLPQTLAIAFNASTEPATVLISFYAIF